jgi:hypothetical protein
MLMLMMMISSLIGSLISQGVPLSIFGLVSVITKAYTCQIEIWTRHRNKIILILHAA